MLDRIDSYSIDCLLDSATTGKKRDGVCQGCPQVERIRGWDAWYVVLVKHLKVVCRKNIWFRFDPRGSGHMNCPESNFISNSSPQFFSGFFVLIQKFFFVICLVFTLGDFFLSTKSLVTTYFGRNVHLDPGGKGSGRKLGEQWGYKGRISRRNQGVF